MKIPALALVASLGLADAKKFNKKAFLRNVVKEGKRRLQDDEQLITSYDKVKFQKCISITVGPSDETGETLFDENNLEYTKAGTLYAAKDVVMWNVCEANDDGSCYFSGDSADLMMTPLATWLENTYNYNLEKDAKYCEACQEAQDYCQ